MSFHQLYLRLVLATATREPLIKPEIEKPLWDALAECSRSLGCEALAVGGMPDHVHLLAKVPPTLSVADLADELMGASATLMREKLLPGADFEWQDSYGALTLRKDEVAKVAAYIERQKEHHVRGQLSAVLERCVDTSVAVRAKARAGRASGTAA